MSSGRSVLKFGLSSPNLLLFNRKYLSLVKPPKPATTCNSLLFKNKVSNSVKLAKATGVFDNLQLEKSK